MSRLRPRARVVAAWLAALALPLLLCFAGSYALSLYHFRSAVLAAAEADAQRASGILQGGAALLTELARTTGGECSPATIATMSRAVFHSVYFREAGIEQDGNLACTSVEMLPPGWQIENAKRTPAARIGAMEILSPTKTIRGGKSLILNLPLRADRSRFVNLLLDPQVLTESVASFEGLTATSLLDDSPNGALIALDRAPPPWLAGLRVPLAPGVHGGAGGLYAIARAGGTPIYAVISVDDTRIDAYWRTEMQPAAVIGFLLSGLALLLLRRYLPKHDAVDDLRQGIVAGELEVEYQPIVDAEAQRVVGAEALVRWRHPQRGRVMPDEFIPLAERSGLIVPLTAAVLAQVRRDLEVLGALPSGFRISVNLARAQLADSHLLAILDAEFGADARLDRLGFEITERELLAPVIEPARALVQELARRGAQVSLDDFGTGYSGLSHLRHLTLHHLKIDRSFVWALDTEAVTASLVESIVALARSLDLGLVAEGVETARQRDRLLALGVRLQQGWLYSKALSVEELRAWRPAERGTGS